MGEVKQLTPTDRKVGSVELSDIVSGFWLGATGKNTQPFKMSHGFVEMRATFVRKGSYKYDTSTFQCPATYKAKTVKNQEVCVSPPTTTTDATCGPNVTAEADSFILS